MVPEDERPGEAGCHRSPGLWRFVGDRTLPGCVRGLTLTLVAHPLRPGPVRQYGGVSSPRSAAVHRVAVLSVHTSPLAQPGTGDAGGMNVYVLQTAKQLAERGVEVEIFTRATSSEDAPVHEAAPGVLVRHVQAGPFEGLDKRDLPTQLCAFAAGVFREEARHAPGYYGLVHSHYWLSGQVGWLTRDRWKVPLVHTAHTLAAVKNASLADGDTPEPPAREIGERQVVAEADRMVANTAEEAEQLATLYGADPAQLDVVAPGADLTRYMPGDRSAARTALGIAPHEHVVTFVGRIQPLKAPDVLLRAAADIIGRSGSTVGSNSGGSNTVGSNLRILVVGGPSGTGLQRPDSLIELARDLGISTQVTFLPPQSADRLVQVYRASDLVAVPSYSESFGLVAIEAQACGTPVVAADVGGLGVAVRDNETGLLVSGHRTADWAGAIETLLADRDRLDQLSVGAARHAENFSWARTADGLLESYRRAGIQFIDDGPAELLPRRPRGLQRRRRTGGVRV
ncbi:MAG: D-inositol-3-phosphate glycosyltransferase [Rhodococcus sp.]|nr:D-inositol-3-phosphate glycosyltransferase [Rhodococcus sp. (in: high G+C Gram-positive bacteria)]